METILEESRVEYHRLMTTKLKDGCIKNNKDLTNMHQEIKEQVVALGKPKCDSITDDEFDQMYNLELLNDEIDNFFMKLKDDFVTKISQEKPDLKSKDDFVTKISQEKPDLKSKDDLVTKESKEKPDLKSQFKSETDITKNDSRFHHEIAIGIDLGTTNCCVAAYHNGKVTVIPNEINNSVATPSYVAINPHTGTTTVGQPAKDNAFRVPESTVYDAKRIIGRKMNDPVLQNDIKYWPFTVTEHEGVPKIEVHGKYYHPEEISAKLLMEMQCVAETYFEVQPGTIKKAVITVPAYFTDGQRQATVDAGTLAGLEVLTILNEPTAAAIAYSFHRLDDKSKNVLIFDLGGGTCDVAVLEMKPGEINVLGVDGNSHLGGEDFDKNMMKFCAETFMKKKNVDLLKNKNSNVRSERDEARRILRRLQMHCERHKQFLSAGRQTEILVEALVNEMDLCVMIKKDEFEKINHELFQGTINIVERALKSSGLTPEQIDDVVLIGGSSRIPKIQSLLKEYFKGRKLNISINPDEAVAFGAAVQAAIMIGTAEDQLILKTIQDVTPMSIGIELYSREHSVILKKNTKIPTKQTKVYVTVYDNQPHVEITIFEGENAIAADNTLLGKFVLDGIPPAKKGMEAVEVTMLINSMGILHVEAESKGSKKKASITVKEYKERISEQQIKELLKVVKL